ncbi:MAG: endolytic transglycosylase MltG, partial [Treponema sp.]|nr:endolytic transglycosylase MltG [Treponema sp.]
MPRPLAALVTIFCILIAFLLLFSAVLIGTVVYFNTPPGREPRANIQDPWLKVEDSHSAVLEVRNGESARSVGNRLEEAGLIRSRYFWDLLARCRKEYIKTGTYRLELPVSSIRLYSVLVSGKQLLLRVTVPEGNTLKKTAGILEEAGICSASGFLAASEDKR